MTPPNVRIDDFCKTGSGGTPSRTQAERYYKDGTVPWVKSGELRESLITKAEEYITQIALQETSTKLAPEGAILLAMYGATVGRLAILGIEAATNQAVCHIIPDPSKSYTKYVYHALASQVPAIISMGVGGAQPNISQGLIRGLTIPLPQLSEQRRITAILDQADALRAKRREALAELDGLAQAIFVEIFGNTKHWPVKPLDDLADDMLIGLVRSASEFGQDFETPYVRMNAIGRNGEFIANLVQRTDATADEIKRYKLNSGDILFNTRNSEELVGKTAIFREEGIYVFNNNVMRIRFNSEVEPEFVASVFLTQQVRQELQQRKSGTTSVFAIYGRDIKTLPIPVPPIKLQRIFSARKRAIEDLKKVHQRALTELDALFASLQHRAFRGEL